MNSEIDVLLIEDSDAGSRITSAAVRRVAPTASLVRVKDGNQALRLLFCKGLFTEEPQIPRLVLLELDAPRANGPAVLERLRVDTIARAVPVIVLMSTPSERHLAEVYALGVQACLVRSFHPDDFPAEVSRVVGPYLGWTH